MNVCGSVNVRRREIKLNVVGENLLEWNNFSSVKSNDSVHVCPYIFKLTHSRICYDVLSFTVIQGNF